MATTDVPLLDSELKIVAPFNGQLKLTRINNGILVTGHLETSVESVCTRCLSAFRATVRFEIEEEFRPTLEIDSGARLSKEEGQDPATLIDERHILDLAEVVRQDLTLSLPPSAVCDPDCQGLCPHCGQDRNEGSCDCQTETTDPRWAALKASFEEV
jgi:uncharacterized protein